MGDCFLFAGGCFDEGFGSISEAPKRQAERRTFWLSRTYAAIEASRSLVSSTMTKTDMFRHVGFCHGGKFALQTYPHGGVIVRERHPSWA